MNKKLLVICLVALILSACDNPSIAEPIAEEHVSVLDRPGHVEYVEAYTGYSGDYTKSDLKRDITVTDTTFTFHPDWLVTPLEIDLSDKNNVKINGYSLNWCEESNRIDLEGEHTFKYSETPKHAYVAYTLRLPFTKASKNDTYAELYHQIHKFVKKVYSTDSVVLDTKTDFKRVIETDTKLAEFEAKYCYFWIECSGLQFNILNYYTPKQSSIDDFYYDD